MAILHLLVSLAMHFRAPIRLPEHVSVQVVVVRVSVTAVSLPAIQREAPRLFPPVHFLLSVALFFLPQEATFYFSLLTKCMLCPGLEMSNWHRNNGIDLQRGRFKGVGVWSLISHIF